VLSVVEQEEEEFSCNAGPPLLLRNLSYSQSWPVCYVRRQLEYPREVGGGKRHTKIWQCREKKQCVFMFGFGD